VTPGPGLLAILAGLAVLATEFVWAERLYERAKSRGRAAYDLATSSKIRIAFSVSLTLLGIAGAVWIWLAYR
ncbi:MAG TPA: PGPGW domain-containing protein, partial [Actinomycetota bacterium]|nr:PGPGW domain-containing protein [Actinomycetota bacterium]